MFRGITTAVIALIIIAGVWFIADRKVAPLPPEWQPLFAAIDGEFQPKRNTQAEGERLSQIHCAACHLRPDAEVLPRKSWLEVFRIHMGRFNQAGILIGPEEAVEGSDEGLREQRLSLPRQQYRNYRMPKSAFTRILYAYLTSAPTESLPQEEKPPFSPEHAPFELTFAPHASRHHQAQYTLATFEPTSGTIILGDSANRGLLVLDSSGHRLWTVPLEGIYPTSLTARPDGLYVVHSGPTFASIVETIPDGRVVRLPWSVLEERPSGVVAETVIDGLRFPVHAYFADLDGDGQDEILVEEFGMSEGALSWYKHVDGAFTEKNVLYDGPGTLDAVIRDFTGNGLPDIVAMVTQADQTIYLFENKGNGAFEKRPLLQQQPAFGFDAMYIKDMNGDGNLELITINGDNDLKSQPLRKYHGVRIWQDHGQQQYEEVFFYPMHGAIQAVIRDFTQDGRLDIVAVSLWPDFSSMPLETAVYLENKGDFSFTPRRIQGAERGRWAVAGAGDFNGNGFEDLILGALYLPGYLPPLLQALGRTRPLSYAVFRNTSPDLPPGE